MAKLRFAGSNEPLDVEPGTSFQEVCDSHATPVLFGCRSASCGTCLIKVLEGMENLSPMEEPERDFLEILGAGPDERLACQTRILGDVLIAVED